MDTVLHTIDIWATADGRIEIYNYKLATKVNRHLKSYDNGTYRFKRGEEGLFKVEPDQLRSLLSLFFKRFSTNAVSSLP